AGESAALADDLAGVPDDTADEAAAFDTAPDDDSGVPDNDSGVPDHDFGDTDDAFGLDVDAALASVSSLSDVIAQREAEEAAERERQQAEARRWASYRFDHPPLATLRRGQLTSFIPALLLMALGAWLTFASSTGDSPDGGLVALVVLGGVGLALLLFWLQSGRWARGALFMALTLTGVVGVMIYLTQFDGPGVDGWPLLIAVPGAAAFLSGILARPADRRLTFTGLALIAGALLTLALTTGFVDSALAADVDSAATEYGWMILVAALVLLVIPLLLRRRA
ncbi:MAG: hypothetical protein ACOCZH_05235, partial [Phototrophicaceae bacterium]